MARLLNAARSIFGSPGISDKKAWKQGAKYENIGRFCFTPLIQVFPHFLQVFSYFFLGLYQIISGNDPADEVQMEPADWFSAGRPVHALCDA